ncbi:hypothetical protein [Nocardia sp. NPDC005366]|uniref:hypothetical protein n=1 Tax=Nocardia sp. NPDC005366 TaxID=3156878 RepID=UPI0033A4D8AB
MRFGKTPGNGDTPDDDDGGETFEDPWAGLEQPHLASELYLVSTPETGTGVSPELVSEGGWMVVLPQTPDAHDTDVGVVARADGGGRVSWRVWAGLVAAVAVLVGVVAVWGDTTGDTGDPVRATAIPPSATSVVEGACTGLSGTVVTDRPGDTTTTVVGLIASFEAAYYLRRSAEAAMTLLAPEAGIDPVGLAAGIASIPVGTTHCVAVTPISETTANVHVVEVRPDRQRTDYLQLVNTRPGDGGGLLISNIQRQG